MVKQPSEGYEDKVSESGEKICTLILNEITKLQDDGLPDEEVTLYLSSIILHVLKNLSLNDEKPESYNLRLSSLTFEFIADLSILSRSTICEALTDRSAH